MKAKYIVGILAAVVLTALAIVTVESKKIEYSDIAGAVNSGKPKQIAGTWVKEKGSSYDPATNVFHFTMRDTTGTELPVAYSGAKPNNFEIATSNVTTGTVENGQLRATNILTKCPSKYESDGSELNPNKQS